MKKTTSKSVIASRLQRESMEKIRNMVRMGAHPAAVDAQMDAEIEKLREYMTPLDVARFVWPECVQVAISKVPVAVLDDYLKRYAMEDLRQGVFFLKTPHDREPIFMMSWETSQRKQDRGGKAC